MDLHQQNPLNPSHFLGPGVGAPQGGLGPPLQGGTGVRDLGPSYLTLGAKLAHVSCGHFLRLNIWAIHQNKSGDQTTHVGGVMGPSKINSQAQGGGSGF